MSELHTPLVHDPRRDAPPSDDEHGGNGSDDEEAEAHEEGTPGWAQMLNKVTSVRDGLQLLADKVRTCERLAQRTSARRAHSAERVCMCVCAQVPHVYYLNGSRIEPMLAKRVGVRQPKLFTLDDFNRQPLDLDLPTVLHGVSNTGKTAFALAHFQRPLVVRRKDDLKRIAAGTDGIIFDDVNFRDWSPEDAICLLEADQPRSLPARFTDAFIEADMPLIFTTNKRPSKIFPRGSTGEQRTAIKRRYVTVEVTEPLQRTGRPFTQAEKRVRREAGRDGPKGPGVGA